MDTFLQTPTLELRPGLVLKTKKSESTRKDSGQPSDEFFTVLRVEMLEALSPYSDACKAASLAFERIFAQFGID